MRIADVILSTDYYRLLETVFDNPTKHVDGHDNVIGPTTSFGVLDLLSSVRGLLKICPRKQGGIGSSHSGSCIFRVFLYATV